MAVVVQEDKGREIKVLIRCGELEKWRSGEIRYDPARRVTPRLAVDTQSSLIVAIFVYIKVCKRQFVFGLMRVSVFLCFYVRNKQNVEQNH